MPDKRKKKEKIKHPTEELSSEWFETILCSLNEGVFCVSED